jgi:hypothetical protein
VEKFGTACIDLVDVLSLFILADLVAKHGAPLLLIKELQLV